MLSDWGEIRKPDVFTWGNVGWAFVVHLAFFALCWLLSIPLPDKEVVIPIDMTVVVNENLDGDPDEPPPEAPPVKQPDPPPPPPPPRPQPPSPPLQPPEETRQDAVVREKPKEKKVEKKPEKPKPTKEEIKKQHEERLKQMRESAKKVKPEKPEPKQPTREDRLKAMREALNDGPPPKNNGKTEKRRDDWEKLLAAGARPGAKNQLSTSENGRCISLIKSRFDTCWAQVGIPPWTDTLKEMHLNLKFGSSGKILSYRLTQSSGDRSVDQTVLQAAKLMGAVYGLSPEFLESNGGNVTIRVKVMPK